MKLLHRHVSKVVQICEIKAAIRSFQQYLQHVLEELRRIDWVEIKQRRIAELDELKNAVHELSCQIIEKKRCVNVC